jgi:hypothetical protein
MQFLLIISMYERKYLQLHGLLLTITLFLLKRLRIEHYLVVMATNVTSLNTLVVSLAIVQKQLTQSLPVLLIPGLLGNLASCAVFRQKELRSNAMSLLFTAASIFNMIVLIYGISISVYGVDHVSPDTYSIVFCKVRLYIRHILLMIVRSYIVLACASGFALSSSRSSLRSLCQPRYVKWAIVAVLFVWPLIALHMPFLTIIRRNQCIDLDSYVLPFAIYFFLIVGIFPVILMGLFTLLTMRNLRLLHRRIQPSIATPLRLKSRDQQFIRMLSALVLMYVATNLFYPTNVLYSAITYWLVKSPERVAIESLVFSVTSNYVLYINNVSPFFLFISSSSAFRQLFRRVVYKCTRHFMSIRGRRPQLPINGAPTERNKF